MRILEIHKNGINAHNDRIYYYGVDYISKNILFSDIESVEEAIKKAKALGYKSSEIQRMF